MQSMTSEEDSLLNIDSDLYSEASSNVNAHYTLEDAVNSAKKQSVRSYENCYNLLKVLQAQITCSPTKLGRTLDNEHNYSPMLDLKETPEHKRRIRSDDYSTECSTSGTPTPCPLCKHEQVVSNEDHAERFSIIAYAIDILLMILSIIILLSLCLMCVYACSYTTCINEERTEYCNDPYKYFRPTITHNEKCSLNDNNIMEEKQGNATIGRYANEIIETLIEDSYELMYHNY